MAGKNIYIERMIESLRGSMGDMQNTMSEMSADMQENVALLTKILNATGSPISVANITGSAFTTLFNKYICKKSVDVYADNCTITFSGNTGVTVANAGGGNTAVFYCLVFCDAASHLVGSAYVNHASFKWDILIDNSSQGSHTNTTAESFDYALSEGWHLIGFRATGTGSGFGAVFTDLALADADLFVPSDSPVISSHVLRRSATTAGKMYAYGYNRGTFNGIAAAIWLSLFVSLNASADVSFTFDIFDALTGRLLLSTSDLNADLSDIVQVNNFIFRVTAEYDPADPGTFEMGGFMMKYM